MPSSEAIWRERFCVRAGEAGPGGTLRFPALCDWLQEAAGNHASSLAFGTADLLAQNLTWVLSRLTLRVGLLPRWGEEAFVETWPSGAHRLWALREFRVLDAAGKELCAATSGWLVLKLPGKRPVRPFPEVLELAARAPSRVLEDPFGELARIESDAESAGAPFHVGRYDLDLNAHANNVSVLRWLFEALPSPPDAFTTSVDFRGECFEGDRLLPLHRRAGGALLHALVRESDGREIARAVTTPVE